MNAPAKKEAPELKSNPKVPDDFVIGKEKPKFTPEPSDTQQAPAAITSAKPRALRAVSEGRLYANGYLHNPPWDCIVENGTILQDVLIPSFWKHTAEKLKQFDEIIVQCEDGSWRAHLLVVSRDRLWAKVFPLHSWNLADSYADMPKTQEEEFIVSWNIVGQYRICRRGNEGLPPIKDGFQTKLEAYQWLDGYIKALNK